MRGRDAQAPSPEIALPRRVAQAKASQPKDGRCGLQTNGRLGRRDILASVDLRGEGPLLHGKDELDVRSKALQLPGGLRQSDTAMAQ